MEPPIDEFSPQQKESIEKKHIFLFELIGTAFFVYISVCAQGNQFYVSLAYFGCLLLFGRLSGGHFNPAVSLALALSGAISYSNLFVYVLPQVIGAFGGGALAFCLLNLDQAPYMEQEPVKQLAASLFGELLGSSLFLTFILIQYVKETRITYNTIAGFIFISLVYFGCREYTVSSSSSLLNPAAALSLTLFDCLTNSWNQMVNIWIFVGGPILGAILATMFYSQLYQQITQRSQ